MNQYVTGGVIKALREKNRLTQAELAARLCVTDKAVSKWETGRGYPDISLLESLAEAFHVSVTELISGSTVDNANVSANMLRAKFYVCPVCGNVITCLGEAVVQCHGLQLTPEEPSPPDENHGLSVVKTEDEYYVNIDHEMAKKHSVSFIAAVSTDTIQLKKLYPEWPAEARFKISGVRKICFFCNKDGLFCIDPIEATDRRG